MTTNQPQGQQSHQRVKRRGINLNMAIAHAHEFATQLVGFQLAAANLLAVAVSATSIVAGTVTYAILNQPGAYPLWVAAGAIGVGLAILIEGMTLSALIRIRLANKQIHAIVTRMEVERDHAIAVAEAASAGGKGKVEGRWKFAARKRYATRAYRKSRRYSIPLALIGALASATAGGLFYHTLLISLGTYQSLGVSALFALVVTGTFVSSELFKEVQEEAVREGFRGGSLAEEALREETYRQTNQAVSSEVTAYLSEQEARDAIRKAATHLLTTVLNELSRKASERTEQPGTGHVTVTEEQTGHLLALPAANEAATMTGQSGQAVTMGPATPEADTRSGGHDGTGQRPAATGQPTVEQDKLERTIGYLSRHPQATDETLAAHLGLNRPASARFWRLKAEQLIGRGQVDRLLQTAASGQPGSGHTDVLPAANEAATTTDQSGHAATMSGHGEQPANVIDMTGHRPGQRPGGQAATTSGHDHDEQADSGQADTTTSGQVVSGEDIDQDEVSASGHQDTAARIAAYRAEHPDAKQIDIADALGISVRTIRRHTSKSEAAS